MSSRFVTLATNDVELVDAAKTINSFGRFGVKVDLVVSTPNLVKNSTTILLPWSDVPVRFDTFEGHVWKTSYLGEQLDVIVLRPGLQLCGRMIEITNLPRVAFHVDEWIVGLPVDADGYEVSHAIKHVLDTSPDTTCPTLATIMDEIRNDGLAVMDLDHINVAYCSDPVIDTGSYGISGWQLVDGLYVTNS